MAEAIGLGASVIAFVGLAGQVVQGCHYIRNVLDDIKDAPMDIQSLRTEVKLFEMTLQTFQSVLSDLVYSGIPIDAGDHARATELALDYSKETIAKLFELITKNDQFGGRWYRIRFAMGKDRYTKNVFQMERAKAYVAAAQANIILSLEHQQAIDTRTTHRSLCALTSTLHTSSSTISTLPRRFDDVSLTARNTEQTVSQLRSDFSQRLHDLSTGVNAILASNFTAFASILSETKAKVEEVHHTVQQTQDAVKHMKATSEGLKSLPMGMAETVMNSLRGVLVEFYYERTETLKTEATKQRCLVAQLTQPSHQQSARRILHQRTYVRKYIRAVGIITVQSTTTTFRDRVTRTSSGPSQPTTSTITQTTLELNPNPDLLRIGVYGSFVEQGFATFDTHPEPELRVFNVVESNAPIVRACAQGQLSNVRELFATGQASPFDRIWGEKSLLDLVLLQVLSTISSQLRSAASNNHMSGLVAVYEELVNRGLDPGVPRRNDDTYGPSPFSALMTLTDQSPQDWSYVTTLGRIMIIRSTYDPTLDANIGRKLWLEAISGVENPLLTLLRTQEDWEISWPDIQALKQTHYAAIRAYRVMNDPFALYTVNYPPVFCGDDLLRDILLYEDGHVILDMKLRDCEGLDEKLKLVYWLINIYGQENMKPNSVWRGKLLPRLEIQLHKCLQSCLEAGLDINQPSPAFHEILRSARFVGYVNTISSVLLQLGGNLEVVNDLVEAELYASLAYQLWSMAKPSTYRDVHTIFWRPSVLQYCRSPDKREWGHYCAMLSCVKRAAQSPDASSTPKGSTFLASGANSRHISSNALEENHGSESPIIIYKNSPDVYLSDNSDSSELNSNISDYHTSGDEEDYYASDDEDMQDEYTSGSDKDHHSPPSIIDTDDNALRIKQSRSQDWESVSSIEATTFSTIGGHDESRKIICPQSYNEIKEAENEDDSTSSILSDLIDQFNVGYQEHDSQDFHSFLAPNTAGQSLERMAPTKLPEDRSDGNDSCDERLDGLTLALNAFWT